MFLLTAVLAAASLTPAEPRDLAAKAEWAETALRATLVLKGMTSGTVSHLLGSQCVIFFTEDVTLFYYTEHKVMVRYRYDFRDREHRVVGVDLPSWPVRR